MIVGAQEIPAWIGEVCSSWVETAKGFEAACLWVRAQLCSAPLG